MNRLTIELDNLLLHAERIAAITPRCQCVLPVTNHDTDCAYVLARDVMDVAGQLVTRPPEGRRDMAFWARRRLTGEEGPVWHA